MNTPRELFQKRKARVRTALKSAANGKMRLSVFRIGKVVAERAAKSGVSEVVFDRGGYIYHGRVKALADAARAAGLKF